MRSMLFPFYGKHYGENRNMTYFQLLICVRLPDLHSVYLQNVNV
jgi:hypothetical protein